MVLSANSPSSIWKASSVRSAETERVTSSSGEHITVAVPGSAPFRRQSRPSGQPGGRPISKPSSGLRATFHPLGSLSTCSAVSGSLAVVVEAVVVSSSPSQPDPVPSATIATAAAIVAVPRASIPTPRPGFEPGAYSLGGSRSIQAELSGPGWRLRPVGHDKRAQAVVVLAARGAPLEVRAQAGKMRIGVGSLELEVHILVEQLEALLARDLESRRAEHALEGPVVPVV